MPGHSDSHKTQAPEAIPIKDWKNPRHIHQTHSFRQVMTVSEGDELVFHYDIVLIDQGQK